jgi:hypothetical protein
MKKLVATAVLGLLTAGSLALAVPSQASALTLQGKNFEPFTSQPTVKSEPELDAKLGKASPEKLVAYTVYCETRIINGRVISCCVDSDGNWACE